MALSPASDSSAAPSHASDSSSVEEEAEWTGTETGSESSSDHQNTTISRNRESDADDADEERAAMLWSDDEEEPSGQDKDTLLQQCRSITNVDSKASQKPYKVLLKVPSTFHGKLKDYQVRQFCMASVCLFDSSMGSTGFVSCFQVIGTVFWVSFLLPE